MIKSTYKKSLEDHCDMHATYDPMCICCGNMQSRYEKNYYEEAVVDGKLKFRTSPTGLWSLVDFIRDSKKEI